MAGDHQEYCAQDQRQWGTQAPGGLRACAMNAAPSQNIGIIGDGADQYTCDQVTAMT